MVLAAMAFNDDVQLNPDLSINRNGRMRKRKRINNWQAEDDEKMNSLYIQHGKQFYDERQWHHAKMLSSDARI